MDPHPTPPPSPIAATLPSPKLLDRLRHLLHQRQFSPHLIEEATRWLTACIHYHGLRHPRGLNADYRAAFMAHLRRDPNLTPQREAAARRINAAAGAAYPSSARHSRPSAASC